MGWYFSFNRVPQHAKMITANSLSNTLSYYIFDAYKIFLFVDLRLVWLNFLQIYTAVSFLSYRYNSATVIVKKRNELGFYLFDPEGSTQRDKMIFPLIYISRIKLMSNPAVADMFFRLKCIFICILWWWFDMLMSRTFSGYMFFFDILLDYSSPSGTVLFV